VGARLKHAACHGAGSGVECKALQNALRKGSGLEKARPTAHGGATERRRPSLADVAAHAGVSLTTASHALSGKRPVGRDTRQAIERAISALGYEPNNAARTLASGATMALGLVVPDIGSEFFAQLAKGVENCAGALGYHVLFTSTNFDSQREERALRLVSARAIDGLIYAAGAPPTTGQLLELMAELPMAILDEELDLPGAVTVASDNVEGGRLVAEHLQALGHENVLVLAGPQELPTSHQRSMGLLAMQEAGQMHCEVRHGGYLGQAGYDLICQEIDQHGQWFTAVFAHNDLTAASAMRALRTLEVSVPEEVSVVGFDDISLASQITPALTTVRQPVLELGELAARRVIEAASGHGPTPERTLLPVELVVRGSTDLASAPQQPQSKGNA
jgi:LacI family transcriptional regulator